MKGVRKSEENVVSPIFANCTQRSSSHFLRLDIVSLQKGFSYYELLDTKFYENHRVGAYLHPQHLKFCMVVVLEIEPLQDFI